MSSVTFDSVNLVRPSFPEIERSPITKETILVSGKRSVQSSTELGFAAAFVCVTDTYANITSLRGKIGSAKTLSLIHI